jgi:hypothetical protein
MGDEAERLYDMDIDAMVTEQMMDEEYIAECERHRDFEINYTDDRTDSIYYRRKTEFTLPIGDFKYEVVLYYVSKAHNDYVCTINPYLKDIADFIKRYGFKAYDCKPNQLSIFKGSSSIGSTHIEDMLNRMNQIWGQNLNKISKLNIRLSYFNDMWTNSQAIAVAFDFEPERRHKKRLHDFGFSWSPNRGCWIREYANPIVYNQVKSYFKNQPVNIQEIKKKDKKKDKGRG